MKRYFMELIGTVEDGPFRVAVTVPARWYSTGYAVSVVSILKFRVQGYDVPFSPGQLGAPLSRSTETILRDSERWRESSLEEVRRVAAAADPFWALQALGPGLQNGSHFSPLPLPPTNHKLGAPKGKLP